MLCCLEKKKKEERREKKKDLASDMVDDHGLKEENFSYDSYCLVILVKFKIHCVDRILLKPVRCLIFVVVVVLVNL